MIFNKLQWLVEILIRIKTRLTNGHPARTLEFSLEEQTYLTDSFSLSAKPVIHVANIGETDLQSSNPNRYLTELIKLAAGEGAEVLPVCAKIEAAIAAPTMPLVKKAWYAWKEKIT